jgi:hypothetical protein
VGIIERLFVFSSCFVPEAAVATLTPCGLATVAVEIFAASGEQ